MKTTLPTVCLLALAGLSVQGGEFRNLGFEDADPELLIGSTWGHWDRMIPGWTPVEAGGWVGYNQPIGMEGYFMLIDDWGRERTPVLSLCPVVDRLAVGVIPNAYLTRSGEPPPPALQQTGLVPEWAAQLRFLWKGERLGLFLDGQATPFWLVEQRLTDDPFVPIHNYYAADVSAYAGREATVRFEFWAHRTHNYPWVDWPDRVAVIDDVHFFPIPEPSPWVLLAVGGLGLWWARRRPGRNLACSDSARKRVRPTQ